MNINDCVKLKLSGSFPDFYFDLSTNEQADIKLFVSQNIADKSNESDSVEILESVMEDIIWLDNH